MFFYNSLAFSMIQQMLAIWFLVPLPFLNPVWKSGSSRFMYCWSLAWRILSITWLACEMSAIVRWFEHSLGLPFFGIEVNTDLFQSCGHCWLFQICWHIECSSLTASSFRVWNSSTGIPSPKTVRNSSRDGNTRALWPVCRLRNEYFKAVYCHPAYLTYMQSTSWETLG